jgi:hypothetical protein
MRETNEVFGREVERTTKDIYRNRKNNERRIQKEK